MATIPRILLRSTNRVDLSVRSEDSVMEYRFNAAATLDDAFAGTGAVMFTVRRNGSFRSPTIRAKRWGLTEESRRGLTSAVYDPDDYVGATSAADADASYLYVEERDMAGAWQPAGPTLIVPPPAFLNSYRPHLTVRGTAPNVAATASRVSPDGTMHFALPRYADSVHIINEGSVALCLSFSAGMPEIEVSANSHKRLSGAVVSEVMARGDGSTADFTMTFAVVNGARE